MTATDELRRMLDERGVEHRDTTPDILHDVTNWVTRAWLADGRWFQAIETQKGDLTLELYGYSPEQAIAATLGRGECRVEWMGTDDEGGFQCLACGAELGPEAEEFHYCPYCGREVA